MRIAIITLLVSVLTCCGQYLQHRRKAFQSAAAAGYNISNEVYTAAYLSTTLQTNTWWEWRDIGPNSWHLTNGTASGNWATKADTNAIIFDGSSDWCQSVAFTNAQPLDIWLVASIPQTGSGNRLMIDSSDSTGTYRNYWYNSSDNYTIWSGSAATLGAVVYGKWFVYEIVLNGAGTEMYTNGAAGMVKVATVNPGNKNQKGLTIGSSASLGNKGAIWINQMWIFPTVPDAITRSNRWNYFTNACYVSP